MGRIRISYNFKCIPFFQRIHQSDRKDHWKTKTQRRSRKSEEIPTRRGINSPSWIERVGKAMAVFALLDRKIRRKVGFVGFFSPNTFRTKSVNRPCHWCEGTTNVAVSRCLHPRRIVTKPIAPRKSPHAPDQGLGFPRWWGIRPCCSQKVAIGKR